MFIDAIGISAYRSFGRDIQRIGPFTKVNLFAGQNNSGKSNILLFLSKHYKSIVEQRQRFSESVKLDTLDKHLGDDIIEHKLAFGLNLEGIHYQQLLQKYENNMEAIRLLEQVLYSKSLTNGTNTAWFNYKASTFGGQLMPSKDVVELLINENILNHRQWQRLWAMLTQQTGGDIRAHWIPETLQRLSPIHFAVPTITIIPAIRRVGEAGTTAEDYSGLGLIDRLAELQHPSYENQSLKVRFEEINDFVRKVVGNSTAKLEIPHDRKMILVHMDNRTLPLSSLGTGIHEVVILAAASTVLQNQILCIEEPELHLHPMLQRKLIRYLQYKTNNQYFITTHSAHFLDTPGTAIFHVRHQQGRSTVEPVYTAPGRAALCADLGYRASDLVQANCVIWVEGPSDRIYITHWIRAIAPELIEGLHYSVMFYGGRLLSHLSANDPEINEFISLRRLNRYITIVIDSDKSSRGQKINETKKRVRDEFDVGPGFAWITKGREIENYISPKLLEQCVKAVHPDAVGLANTGQFDHCLPYVTTKKATKDRVDKVKVAHKVAEHPADLEVLDLRLMINKLVAFIRSSNDYEEIPDMQDTQQKATHSTQ